MKFKHSFKNYTILCAAVVVVLLGVYGILILTNTIKNTTPKPIAVSSVINCSFSDKSFCATDQLMRGYVSSKDFSDILENQIPVNMSCASKTQAQKYCDGAQSNLVIQLFQIGNGNPSGPQLYTRNNYITYFRAYFAQHGPFTFAGEKTVGPTIQMLYTNVNQTAQYVLTFIKQSGTWKFAYPTVSTT
jgi:hypothetical protein